MMTCTVASVASDDLQLVGTDGPRALPQRQELADHRRWRQQRLARAAVVKRRPLSTMAASSSRVRATVVPVRNSARDGFMTGLKSGQ